MATCARRSTPSASRTSRRPASGNVRFDSSVAGEKLQATIEKGLGERFGYEAHVQVIERGRLERVVDAYPFGAAGEDSHDYVVFMERGLEKDLAAEKVELGKDERVEAGDGVVYWRVDKGSTLQSPFGKLLAKAKYRDFNTNRNLRTCASSSDRRRTDQLRELDVHRNCGRVDRLRER
jgi:uncharacterized protein (DUF1697 family)